MFFWVTSQNVSLHSIVRDMFMFLTTNPDKLDYQINWIIQLFLDD